MEKIVQAIKTIPPAFSLSKNSLNNFSCFHSFCLSVTFVRTVAHRVAGNNVLGIAEGRILAQSSIEEQMLNLAQMSIKPFSLLLAIPVIGAFLSSFIYFYVFTKCFKSNSVFL